MEKIKNFLWNILQIIGMVFVIFVGYNIFKKKENPYLNKEKDNELKQQQKEVEKCIKEMDEKLNEIREKTKPEEPEKVIEYWTKERK